MASPKYDYIFKILLIGEGGDDNLPFLLRFTDGRFTADNSISKIINFYHFYIL